MLSISFTFFERQLFQESGLLADIANRVVFRNVYGTEKFINDKLLDKHGMVHRIVLGR